MVPKLDKNRSPTSCCIICCLLDPSTFSAYIPTQRFLLIAINNLRWKEHSFYSRKSNTTDEIKRKRIPVKSPKNKSTQVKSYLKCRVCVCVCPSTKSSKSKISYFIKTTIKNSRNYLKSTKYTKKSITVTWGIVIIIIISPPLLNRLSFKVEPRGNAHQIQSNSHCKSEIIVPSQW